MESFTSTVAKPFFKWAGGKASLVPQLLPLLPKDVDKRRHVEPFLGSGALFFAREPKSALLADANQVLINTYQCVWEQPSVVIQKVRVLIKSHSEERYYKRRDLFNRPTTILRKSVLFLYLNKTCFNGLYRVNAEGKFNVPIGRYKKIVLDEDAIRAASRVMRANWGGKRFEPNDTTMRIVQMDFVHTADFVDKDDFVYLDPPYDGENSFRSYTGSGFDGKEQMRLARVFHQMSGYGAKVMLSTSDTPLIRELYKGLDFTVVSARRSVAASGAKRKQVSELVIRNYK